MSDLNTLKTLIDQSFTAVSEKGVTVTGAKRKTLPAKIAEISEGCPALPDLVAGGTYKKTDNTPVVISAISGETTAIRLLVAATGPMKTALVLTFSGSPVIDWGDGTTTTPTSGTAAVHQYDGVNPIPCGRPWGVYLITVTGGTVTAIASSQTRDDWGGAIGNIVSVAVKSAALTSIAGILYSNSALVRHYLTEAYYVDAPVTSFSFALNNSNQFRSVYLKSAQLAPFAQFVGLGTSGVTTLDLSNVRVNGDLTITTFFINATSILFNPENTELGNINIQYNSLSVDGFVALFESLPTVTGKTIQIGGSVAALALTAEQIAVATGKGWTVTRSY